MLASAPVRALADRRAIAAAAGVLCAAAVFLSAGLTLSRLVWIGAAGLLLAALAVVGSPRISGPAAAFLASLGGLAAWFGLTTLWSASPDRSWIYTNMTLVYLAFAMLGVLAAVTPERAADGAAVLLAALFGWALLAKCVPSIYSDYGTVARLRAPLAYWNELALYAVVAMPLALRLRRRVVGAFLLYVAALTLLLTYSRFGIALACLAAVAWFVLERERRAESILVAVLAAAGAAVAFGVALALPGITNDYQPRSVRAHDGWLFALAVLAVGLAVGAVASRVRLRESLRPRIERLAAIAGAAVAVAVVALAFAFAGRIWHSFANPVSSQIGSGSGHLASFSSSNRWRWWQE